MVLKSMSTAKREVEQPTIVSTGLSIAKRELKQPHMVLTSLPTAAKRELNPTKP